jgi:hypothetical protein
MGKQSGICCFCGETRRFAKAHVISKTLFKDLFQRYGKVHLLNVKDIDGNNKVQDAFYDTHILCVECDNSFSLFEDYFVQLLRGELLASCKIARVERKDFGQYLVDTYRPVNYLYLRLFYLLTLWRCSISQQSSFSTVSLGTEEQAILALLKSKSGGDCQNYATVLVSFAEVDDIRALSAISPANATVDNLPITVILFDQWAIIYCMKKQANEWFFQYALDGSDDLSIVVFKEPFGVNFLNQLTHNQVHVKKADVLGV